MLNITVSSGASRAELLAVRVAIDALLMPETSEARYESAKREVSVHIGTDGSVRPIGTSEPAAPIGQANIPAAEPTSDNDPGDEQPGLDAEGKPKRTRRTKAQIEADKLAEADRIRLASNPPATHGTVSSADSTAPLNPPFQGAPQPAPTAPAANAAAALFGDSFPAVSPPEDAPATLGDLMALVNDLLAVDSAKGMAGCVQIASEFGVASFKQLDTSKFGEARAKLRALLASLKAGAQ